METDRVLAIDIGNSHTVLGVMSGTEVVAQVRFTTRARTTDEIGIFMLQALAHRGVTPEQLHGVIICSVVPAVMYEVEKACVRYLRQTPMVVGRGLKTRLKVRTDNPREVGADRIVNAVAALERFGPPIIIVAFAAATTVDCVNADGEYIGGAIAPGIRMGEEALVSKTQKLPRVELVRPPSVIGRNTVAAMQAGLYFGFVGMVDELALRCAQEMDGAPKVVATGGLASLVAEQSRMITEVDPHLTLRGLALLYARNR